MSKPVSHRSNCAAHDCNPLDGTRRYRDTDHLRVLIANERKDRLALVAPIVVALRPEVIAREIDVEDVGPVTPGNAPM